MSWYNGYSPAGRNRKLKALHDALRQGEVQPPAGPCALCGDPESPVEYHSEDYSEPFLWSPPAMYALCRHCHRHKLHKRFWDRPLWEAFKAHVRRGGYARDLKSPPVKREVQTLQQVIAGGETMALRSIRPYQGMIGQEWWEQLSLDEASLTSSAARPRP